MTEPDAGPLARLRVEVEPWADQHFDPAAAMVWNPPGSLDDEGVPAHALHQVPQSAWYALTLLERGDADTASHVIDALLSLQYDEPGTPWHGTFARFLEWPAPTAGAREWEDYDPNWRQFVGIAFALALRHHRGLLDDARARRMEEAMALAVAGEQATGRLHWYYTNIALQHAWLLVEAGAVEQGEALATEVAEHWRAHRSFPEYNSPTYDGVDLWALALWRGHSTSAALRRLGAELEAGLWSTVAARFHPGLGCLAGPYGRAYGLDLHRHVAKVALVMLGAGVEAPLPRPATGAAHSHDLLSLPALSLARPEIPAGAMAQLESFGGERSLHETITSTPTRRESSAWLGRDVVIGAEHGDSNWTGWFQFVAGTVHWRRTDGSIGVLRYVPDGRPTGRAEPGLLRSEGPGRIEVHESEPSGVVHSTRRQAGDTGVTVLETGTTTLDGVTVTLREDGDGFVVEVVPGRG